MKRITYILISIFLLLLSCNPVRWTTIGNGDNMMTESSGNYTRAQFDSVCNSKSISNDLSDWISLPLMDDESKTKLYKYMYIQKMDSLEIIYTLFINDDKYNLDKRITY